MSKPLEFSYDAPTDVLTIEGVEYCGVFFRRLAGTDKPTGFEIGRKFKVVELQKRILTLEQLP